METKQQVKTIIQDIMQIEEQGFWFFPAIFGSLLADFILDDTLTKQDYESNPENWLAQEYNGTRYRYTQKEMDSGYNFILCQRIQLAAARLVLNGKYIAINPALRSLGVQI